MTTFLNPPFFSAATPIAAIMAVGRMLGLGRQTLNTVLGLAAGKNSKARVFAGYEPSSHDVFCTVYSKSGTNWLMQIVQQLICNGQAEFGHIHEVVAWPDAAFPGITPFRDDSVWKASPTGLRAIKTSLEADYVPYSEAATYISILRDPKEVFVSSYHFLAGTFGMKRQITMNQWFEVFIGDEYVGGDWAEYMAGYWKWRDRPNVLLLQYADLKRDLRQGVESCAKVMGLEPSDEVLSAVVERASFSYMKARSECFDPPRFRFMPADQGGVMLRGGSDREKREVLTAEQRERIDHKFMTKLEQLGCDLPYAELYLLD